MNSLTALITAAVIAIGTLVTLAIVDHRLTVLEHQVAKHQAVLDTLGGLLNLPDMQPPAE